MPNEYNREYTHKRRAEHARLGLCSHCKEPHLPNRTLCEHHREYIRNYQRDLRNTRRCNKLCLTCGDTLHPSSKASCWTHLIRTRRYMEKRRKEARRRAERERRAPDTRLPSISTRL